MAMDPRGNRVWAGIGSGEAEIMALDLDRKNLSRLVNRRW